MKTKRHLLTAAVVMSGLVLSLSQPESVAGEPAQNLARGTPGVATQRAVLNFAELARQAAPGVVPQPNVGLGAPAEFTPASMGGTAPSPAPASSFPGLIDDTFQAPPSDTHGAVGPNHLMEVSNYGVHIQDRSGRVISTVLVSNFWAQVGPFNDFIWNGTNWGDVADTKVVYDHFENRWIFTTLANAVSGGPAALLLGVSQTSDPTANWNLYRIEVDPTKTVYFDHPDVGFNKDWIVASGPVFRLSNRGFVRSDIYVFNKTNSYAGGAGLYTLFQRTDSGLRNLAPAITFDSTVSKIYLLGAVIPCCTDSGFNNLSSLRLYTITGQVGSEVFTVGPTILTTNRWDNFGRPRGSNFAPQLGSTNRLYLTEGLMRSLIYRNGSLWAAHDGFLPAGGSPTRSAIFWYQISPQGLLLQQGRIDDPTGEKFYAYSSLAVNRFDDVLIGYSRFSSNQYISANYSFRAASDPPNTLRADTVLKAGEAPYRAPAGYTRNVWADTSATVVDPINDLEFWTIQTYAASPANGQERWGTWWGRIAPLRVLSIAISGSDLRIRFTTETNQSYRVEHTESLAAPIFWEAVAGATNVPGTGGPVEVIDAATAGQAQRFYRVRLN
jgi:hypothetical protein